MASTKKRNPSPKKSRSTKDKRSARIKSAGKVKKTRRRSTQAKKVDTLKSHVAVEASAHSLHQLKYFHQHRLFFFVALFCIGLTMMVGGAFYLLYRQTILSFKVAPVYQVVAENRGSQPQRVKINSVNIDLPITPAHIVGGVWETSDSTATHLITSARPGEKSNIVVYGHNRSHLFKALHDVEVGQIITLITEDGNEYQYQINEQLVVTPDQIDVVLPSEKEELTLYTCTGFLDSKRLVIKASPISVSYSL